MGADIAEEPSGLIRGCRPFRRSGGGYRLRAGAGLVLAGLAAEGCSTIHGLHYIDRGYEAIDEKLRSVGAKVYRSESPTGIPQLGK